jgi:DNA-binding ferritin-like protein
MLIKEKEMEKTQNTNIFGLEYSKMEKAEIITHLSKLLNSYQVHIHNLRYLKWNVIGQDHFELSQRFKTCQSTAEEHMDQIAARISLLKDGVTDSWKIILKTSAINEVVSKLTGF